MKITKLRIAIVTASILIAIAIAYPIVKDINRLGEVQSSKKGLRVLFVGNSLTFYNDMPGMVRKLSEAAGEELPVLAVQETLPNWFLKQHCENGNVNKLLDKVTWDYVVLQEHSVTPTSSRSQREQEMYQYARQLDARIRASGSRTIHFMTWGDKNGDQDNFPGDTYAAQQDRYCEGYQELAGELSAEVAPVGLAWAKVLQRKPQFDLWDSDGHHPSRKGSYLSACVFYAVLYGRDPTGNTFTANLDASEARLLQEVAGGFATKRRSQAGDDRPR